MSFLSFFSFFSFFSSLFFSGFLSASMLPRMIVANAVWKRPASWINIR